MRDIKIKGDNYAPITDYRGAKIGKIIQMDSKASDISVEYTKSETTLKDIFKEKLIEYLIGVAMGFFTYGAKIILNINSFDIGFKIILLFIMFILGAITAVMFYSATIDIVKALSLRKKGKFIEFQSKRNAMGTILTKTEKLVGNNDNDGSLEIYRNVGKVYKNVDGIIYNIKGCKCPFCESEPIGSMNFVYNKINNQYELVCNEQSAHRLAFDYKKNI